jgi:hypothetical protein
VSVPLVRRRAQPWSRWRICADGLTRGAQIGLPARLLSPTTSSSLLAAGLLSAAIFQGTALRLLHSHGPAPAPAVGPKTSTSTWEKLLMMAVVWA